MKLKKLNLHERDNSIVFDEKPHIYYIDGSSENIMSVTTFIHEFFPIFDADLIINKMMNSPRWEQSKYYGQSKEEILQGWEDNRELAAHQGTMMHRDIELFYNDEKVENKSKEFEYFLNFQKEYTNLEPFRTEWEVYDEDLLLAGSIDMLFRCKETNQLIIYDWKRSKDIKEQNPWESGKFPVSHLPHANFWHYSLQLNMYKAILEKKYGEKVKEMYLLWLHPKKDDYIRLKIPNLTDEVSNLFGERRQVVDGFSKTNL